jgi:hypothetical protein
MQLAVFVSLPSRAVLEGARWDLRLRILATACVWDSIAYMAEAHSNKNGCASLNCRLCGHAQTRWGMREWGSLALPPAML